MSLTSYIKSGSHFEIQFSEAYVKLLMDKAFIGGLVPKTFTQGDITIEVLNLRELKFIEENGANISLAIRAKITHADFPIPLTTNLGARAFIEFDGTKVKYQFKNMSDEARNLLEAFGYNDLQINVIDILLAANIKGEYDFSKMVKNAASFKSKVIVSKSGYYESCLSLLINVKGITASAINIDEAKSFLKKGQEFALGMGSESFPAFVEPIKAKMQEWVDDNFTDDYVRSASITPKNSGKLKLKMYIKGIYEGIDCLDPDIDAQTYISINIIRGKLNLKADDTDIEIGTWFTDVVVAVLGAIAGGVVGFLVGGIFGGPALGAIIGGSIVGTAGLFGIHESILEEFADDAASQFLATIYTVPYNMKIADGVEVDHYFVHKEIDSKGMAFEGLQKRTLIGVGRTDTNLLSTIELDDNNFLVEEALANVLNNAIVISDLKIKKVRKDQTRITHLMFHNDVVMSVDETIDLQLKGMWQVAGVKIIRAASGKLYYRTVAGDDLNLDDYPTFRLD